MCVSLFFPSIATGGALHTQEKIQNGGDGSLLSLNVEDSRPVSVVHVKLFQCLVQMFWPGVKFLSIM